MKASKWISALLAGSMTICTLIGCATVPSAGSTVVSNETASTAIQEQGTDEQVQQAEDVAVSEAEDITEIRVMLWDMRGNGDNATAVIDAMNEITEKTIGVHANIEFVTSADYATQFGLLMAGGEALDVASFTPGGPASFISMISSGQLMDISEYLEEEGKDIKEMFGDYIMACSSGGKIYGVPPYRNVGASIYLLMRKDILEDVGMVEQAEALHSWSGVEEIFNAVKEKTDISCIGDTKQVYWKSGKLFVDDEWANTITYDSLGDPYDMIYTHPDGTITLMPESEEFAEQAARVRDWYNKGYVYKDSMTTTDHPDTMMKAGVIFSDVQNAELGVEITKKEATGYDLVCAEISPGMLTSIMWNKFGLGVPVTSAEPSAAVKWINELYTNPELENLVVWGVEGRDYVVKDGEATYPDGLDSASVPFHNVAFAYGNAFNALPWEGNGKDFNEVSYNYLRSLPVSEYLGFSLNQSELTNIVSAIYNTEEKYYADIKCGNYTDELLAEFINQLKSVGAEEYIQAAQQQLDEWKANN